MGAVCLISPSAPAVAVEVVRFGEIPFIQQAPHLGEGVRNIRQRLGNGPGVVAFVVEQNTIMGKTAKMQGPQRPIAKRRGVAPIERRRLHPCGVDACCPIVVFLSVRFLHYA